jgi:hypothetical protein
LEEIDFPATNIKKTFPTEVWSTNYTSYVKFQINLKKT